MKDLKDIKLSVEPTKRVVPVPLVYVSSIIVFLFCIDILVAVILGAIRGFENTVVISLAVSAIFMLIYILIMQYSFDWFFHAEYYFENNVLCCAEQQLISTLGDSMFRYKFNSIDSVRIAPLMRVLVVKGDISVKEGISWTKKKKACVAGYNDDVYDLMTKYISIKVVQ